MNIAKTPGAFKSNFYMTRVVNRCPILRWRRWLCTPTKEVDIAGGGCICDTLRQAQIQPPPAKLRFAPYRHLRRRRITPAHLIL